MVRFRREGNARFAVPLVLSVALFGLYWILKYNPVGAREVNQETRKWVLLLAQIALIFFATRVVQAVIFDLFASRRRNVVAPQILRDLVALLLYFFLIGTALSKAFEFDLKTFFTSGAVLAAVVALALQETLGNLFSGIALHMEESFTVGDVLHSGDYIGVVEGISWRATRIRAFNNQVVVLPNSVIARDRLEIFPRNNLNARVLQVGIDYNVPPAKAIEVLSQAAAHVDGVAHEQPCYARVGGFADSAVMYELKYFMRDYSHRDRIDAAIRRAVWYALRRNEMAIPFPVRAFHPYAPQATPEEITGEEVRKHLRAVAILAPLPDDALESVAASTRIHRYAKGETILRGGAAGDSMFVVHSGEVSIRVSDPDETGTQEVARLGADSVFGEMALLTGERRTADVVAVEDVVALEIGKDSLQPVLQKHPELVTTISSQVVQRRDRLEAFREELPEEEEAQTLLSRIRSYFGL